MLLDAAGDSPPQSTQPHLAQPPHIQAYQTHVFAPPVTGPPGKKRPVEKTGTVIEPYTTPAGARLASTAVAAGLPAGGFPATNDKGQRICRQCGLPGRYKDGKCVEKWGPGPEGPGTVCDRCRKKMKRVERRGTLDPHVLHSHGVSPPSPPAAAAPAPAPLTGAHTLPARLVHPPIATLSDRAPAAALVPASDRSHSRSHSGRSRTPSEPEPAPGHGDADAGDHEDEADVDDDLLEAVDAAEAQSNGTSVGSSAGHHPLTNGNGNNAWVKHELDTVEA